MVRVGTGGVFLWLGQARVDFYVRGRVAVDEFL